MLHLKSRGWIRVQHQNIWTGKWDTPGHWFFDPRSGWRGGAVIVAILAAVVAVYL